MEGRLKSCLCRQPQLGRPAFAEWLSRLGWGGGLHRKDWEHAFIAQALAERGMLAPGRRGLGFGVGKEPLVALFASHGCEAVATDQAPDQARDEGWHETHE